MNIEKAIHYNRARIHSRELILHIQSVVGAHSTAEFDEDTVRSIAAWQKTKGLAADGMLGPKSSRYLPALPRHDPETTHGAVIEAERDWRANTGEHDTSDDGALADIYRTSGWSNRVAFVEKRGRKRPADWCGMATVTWMIRAGFDPRHRASFYSTSNVRAFYTYGEDKRPNRKRYVAELDDIPIRDAHGDRPRRWLDRAAILAAGEAGPLALDALDIMPGDTCLIAGAGKTPHHITMVRFYSSPVLCTIEGNASGFGPDGDRRRESVVVNYRDLSDPAVRARIYAIGRPSPFDWSN